MKKKKLIGVLLAGAMVLSMAGCGESGSGTESGNASDTGSSKGGSSSADAGGDTPSVADSGEVVEIRFTEWDGGDTLAVYEEVAENFKDRKSVV